VGPAEEADRVSGEVAPYPKLVGRYTQPDALMLAECRDLLSELAREQKIPLPKYQSALWQGVQTWPKATQKRLVPV